MEIPEILQAQYDAVTDKDPSEMDKAQLAAYKQELDAVYHEIEALEPDENDEENFLAWEELLETLDDCYDDLYDCQE